MHSMKDCIAYLNTTQWHRIAVVLFVGLLGIGYGVGFSVTMQRATKEADDEQNHFTALFAEWQMTITSTFTKASSLAQTLGAFVTTSALTPMNYSAPALSRVEVVDNIAYYRLCKDMVASVPGIVALQLQSGGVLSQSFPNGTAPIGLDLLASAKDSPGYNAMIKAGTLMIVGPVTIAQGGIGVFIRYPVFVSDDKSRANFWGSSNVVIRIVELVAALGIQRLPIEEGVDYVLWHSGHNATSLEEAAELTEDPFRLPTIVATSTVGTGRSPMEIMHVGMRMRLPIAEPGKTTYMALWPIGGPRSASLETSVLLGISLSVLLGAMLVVAMLYALLFLHFAFRHRHAPATDSRSTEQVFMAALTLRSAQPLVEGAPLESVRLFNAFFARVHAAAAAHGCYAICEVGDRCVYVVAKEPQRLLQLAQECVASIAIVGGVGGIRPSNRNGGGTDQAASALGVSQNSASVMGSRIGAAAAAAAHIAGDLSTMDSFAHSVATTATTATNTTNMRTMTTNTTATNNHRNHRGGGGGGRHNSTPTNASMGDGASSSLPSSLVKAMTIVCTPSAACHAARAPRCYDAARDRYFYGSTTILGKLGAAVDATVSGEVAWTSDFEAACCAHYGIDTATEAFMGSTLATKSADVRGRRARKAVRVSADIRGGSDVTLMIGAPHSVRALAEGGKIHLLVASWGKTLIEGLTDCGGATPSAIAAAGGGGGGRGYISIGDNSTNPSRADDDEGSIVLTSSVYSMHSTATDGHRGGGLRLLFGRHASSAAITQSDASPLGHGPTPASSTTPRNLALQPSGGSGTELQSIAGRRAAERQQQQSEAEEGNEDPSTVMAILADPYIQRMCVIASDERTRKGKGSGRRRAGDGAGGRGDGTKGAGGSKSAAEKSSSEATAISRFATVLHIAFEGDARLLLEVVRRVVADERGAIVSAHENVIVCAYNLLAPNGQHQVRAADTVARLRSVLHPAPFVCSIHCGRVQAMVSPSGWVMCSGDAVSVGRMLLDRAIFMATRRQAELYPSKAANNCSSSTLRLESYVPAQNNNFGLFQFAPMFASVSPGTSGDIGAALRKQQVPPQGQTGGGPQLRCPEGPYDYGLCLLYCQSELSTAYGCEAVDVTMIVPRSGVQHQMAAQGATESALRAVPTMSTAQAMSSRGADTGGLASRRIPSIVMIAEPQHPHAIISSPTIACSTAGGVGSGNSIVGQSQSHNVTLNASFSVGSPKVEANNADGTATHPFSPTSSVRGRSEEAFSSVMSRRGGGAAVGGSAVGTTVAPAVAATGGSPSAFGSQSTIILPNTRSVGDFRLLGKSMGNTNAVLVSVPSGLVPTGASGGGATTNVAFGSGGLLAGYGYGVGSNLQQQHNQTHQATVPSSGLAASRPRVLYRLCDAKSSGADDEWMYQLKEGEDANVHARLNAVFSRIAVDDVTEAERLLLRIPELSWIVAERGATYGHNTSASAATDDGGLVSRAGGAGGGACVSSSQQWGRATFGAISPMQQATPMEKPLPSGLTPFPLCSTDSDGCGPAATSGPATAAGGGKGGGGGGAGGGGAPQFPFSELLLAALQVYSCYAIEGLARLLGVRFER